MTRISLGFLGAFCAFLVAGTAFGDPVVRFDYGDANELRDFGWYPTTLALDGARHIQNASVYMGRGIDTEVDGAPSVNADGDDTAGVDDEDGITFTGTFVPGGAVSLTANLTFPYGGSFQQGAALKGWIDYNGDGAWGADEVCVDAAYFDKDGAFTNTIVIPTDAEPGTTYGRFRLLAFTGATPNMQPTGELGNGEVEDYKIVIETGARVSYDFGDAPDTYGTTLASDGARHLTDPEFQMASNIPLEYPPDSESDGLPTTGADGDDNDNLDDENGVTFPTELFPGQSASIQVSVINSMMVIGTAVPKIGVYIDFNGDGDFLDLGEEVYDGGAVVGANTINFTVPSGATEGTSYCRVRLAMMDEMTSLNVTPTGLLPVGEVEDYAIDIGATEDLDYGDANDDDRGSYPTTLANDGARHVIPAEPATYLGKSIDADADGQPSVNADGDDSDAQGDDEDGLTLAGYLTPGATVPVQLDVTCPDTTGSQGGTIVEGWIDFNQDGVWSPSEKCMQYGYDLTASYSEEFSVPRSAVPGDTYCRVRIFTYSGFTPTLYPTGLLSNGEVEDYKVTIIDETSLPRLSIGDRTATEGDTGTKAFNFAVKLSAASTYDVTVDYTTADNTAMTSDGDYVAKSNTLTYTAGQTNKTISVTVNGDTKYENNERFFVDLSSPVNATISDSQGVGTIQNDDSVPAISIADAGITEGDSGTKTLTFNVTRTGATAVNCSVAWATSDGSAKAGEDYVTGGGTLTMAAGLEGPFAVPVTINGDYDYEADEIFTVALYSPSNCTISDGGATGTIRNDDGTGAEFGDAPDSYGTTLANNGALHPIAPELQMTTRYTLTPIPPDTESDGQPTIGADGDDLNGTLPDDEDGVVFATPLLPGQPATILVYVENSINLIGTQGTRLAGYVDFNGDGDFLDAGEEIYEGAANDGVNTLNITVPAGATVGATYARFRVAVVDVTEGPDFVQPTGPMSTGEVEDYKVQIGNELGGTMDFGDAPDPNYPTMLVSNGARHIISTNIYLGQSIDGESDGLQSPGASGDDTAGLTDDEDGIAFLDQLVPGSTCRIKAVINYNGSQFPLDVGPVLYGWIDFNADGDWNDAGERIIGQSTPYPGGDSVYTIQVPAQAVAGYTFARFRLRSELGRDPLPEPLRPTGQAADGEVEDYRVQIVAGNELFGLTVRDQTLTEGDSGTKTFNFTVSLSDISTYDVDVDFETADVTALTAADDYVATNGTLTIPAGQVLGTIQVTVNGDTRFEGDEQFLVNLSNPLNAQIADGEGVGTILNDDVPAGFEPQITLIDPSSGTGWPADGWMQIEVLNTDSVTVDGALAEQVGPTAFRFQVETNALPWTDVPVVAIGPGGTDTELVRYHYDPSGGMPGDPAVVTEIIPADGTAWRDSGWMYISVQNADLGVKVDGFQAEMMDQTLYRYYVSISDLPATLTVKALGSDGDDTVSVSYSFDPDGGTWPPADPAVITDIMPPDGTVWRDSGWMYVQAENADLGVTVHGSPAQMINPDLYRYYVTTSSLPATLAVAAMGSAGDDSVDVNYLFDPNTGTYPPREDGTAVLLSFEPASGTVWRGPGYMFINTSNAIAVTVGGLSAAPVGANRYRFYVDAPNILPWFNRLVVAYGARGDGDDLVSYSYGPETGTWPSDIVVSITDMHMQADDVVVSWTGTNDWLYTLKVSTNIMVMDSWSNVTDCIDLIGVPGVMNGTHQRGAMNPRGYYRVISAPIP